MKSEELPKERTLAKCSCCQRLMYKEDGSLADLNQWRLMSYEQRSALRSDLCEPCIDEAMDLGISIQKLRERNNERSVETHAF